MVALTRVAQSFSAIVLAFMIPCISAGAFLHAIVHEDTQVAREIIESTLLAELSMDSARLRAFEDELRPMYLALPKNEHGAMDPTAVRYALHRYFVRKHGWYVKGLEPAGQMWNSSSPTGILQSRVPAVIQSFFEQRLHGEGMSLHEVAVFAATLSDLVHDEALSDVLDLYDAFDMSSTMPASKEDINRVIKGYVLQLLLGSTKITGSADLHDLERDIEENFPHWGDLKLWVEDVQMTSKYDRALRRFDAEECSFGRVNEEVQELNHRLGGFQDIECKSIKAGLAAMEFRGTGRVLLSDFYSMGLTGKFLFTEHVDYLRTLGALDESDPEHPLVIISNYLQSPSNCLMSTSFHSVCCFDECEGLMGHLERAIAAPIASPRRIAELVSGLQSDSVDAPRNLSALLVSRLWEIADHHDGSVPLHGRLFAQWMHHAYPLECPYPHAGGTIRPLTPDEWMDESGMEHAEASQSEREARLTPNMTSQINSADLPWMAVEELVAHHSAPVGWFRRSMTRKVAAFAAVLAFVVPVARASSAFILPNQATSEKCHMV